MTEQRMIACSVRDRKAGHGARDVWQDGPHHYRSRSPLTSQDAEHRNIEPKLYSLPESGILRIHFHGFNGEARRSIASVPGCRKLVTLSIEACPHWDCPFVFGPWSKRNLGKNEVLTAPFAALPEPSVPPVAIECGVSVTV